MSVWTSQEPQVLSAGQPFTTIHLSASNCSPSGACAEPSNYAMVGFKSTAPSIGRGERLRESAGSGRGARTAGTGWAGPASPLSAPFSLFVLATVGLGSGPKWPKRSTSSCICDRFLLLGLGRAQLISDCKTPADTPQEVAPS